MPALRDFFNLHFIKAGRENAFVLIILSSIAFVFFFRSLDIYFLSENIGHIEGAQSLLSHFQNDYYFRPIWALTLVIDKFLWGANYSGYHLSNLIFHTISSLLVYVLAYQMVSNRLFAFASSLLFLVHPIHSLSIFWISGRTDLVCSIFYLSSIIFFLSFNHSGKIKYQVLSLIAFLLALLSKEMAVSLPLVIFVYMIIFSEEVLKTRISIAIKGSSAHFILLIFFFMVKMLITNEGAFTNAFHSNVAIFQMAKNLASYIGLLIIPGGHIAIANFLKENPVVFGVLSISSIIAFAFLLSRIRKSKEAIFFMLFIVITLVPVIRLMMRWYLYIPSVGFCLAIGYGLIKMYQTKRGKRLAMLGFVVLAVTYGGFLQLEQSRWVRAGEISRKISYDIARIIAAQSENRFVFLNTPAELGEIPIMIFGLESFVNFRLRNDFGTAKRVAMSRVSYVSLSKLDDLDKMAIQKLGEGIYELDLRGTQSNFIFPFMAEVVNKKRHLKEGEILSEDFGKTKIIHLNDKREVDQIIVEIKDKSIPVLRYESGNINLDRS